jgi:hypothetical protein
MPRITTGSEHISHWTRTLRILAELKESAPSLPSRSCADRIINTFAFEFSVATASLGIRFGAELIVREGPEHFYVA